ncbi:MAG: SIS domain-containing protein, partial [Acidobacteriota bacterium]
MALAYTDKDATPQTAFLGSYIQSLRSALDTVNLNELEKAVTWFKEARDEGRRIFVLGNGGSASSASHFATDIVKGASYGHEKRFRIIALTDSMSTVTAYANDVSFDCVFAEQLKNFAEPGDVVLAISSSGNSPNVLRAVECANELGCRTIGMTGRDGGKLGPISQINLHVGEAHTGRIEDAHMVMCHMIAYYFMEAR